MKLGIDIHGVLNEKPEMFKMLCGALLFVNAEYADPYNEIHIISGPPGEVILKELSAHGFKEMYHYTHVFSIVDHHKSLGTPMTQDSAGNWHMDHYLWDRTKGDYCLKHNIDLMIDDSDVYDYHFKTPFARFKSKTKRTWHVNVDEIIK